MKRNFPETSEMNPELGNEGVTREKRKARPMKRQFQKIKCHFCRTSDVDQSYHICSNYPSCRRGFCANCLRKSFKMLTSKIRRGHWQCPACEGICFCSRCVATSGQLGKEAGGIPQIMNQRKARPQLLPQNNPSTLSPSLPKGDQVSINLESKSMTGNTQLSFFNRIERESRPIKEKKCYLLTGRVPEETKNGGKNSKKENKSLPFVPMNEGVHNSEIPEEQKKKLNVQSPQTPPHYSNPSGFLQSQPIFQPSSRNHQTFFLRYDGPRQFENPEIFFPSGHLPLPQNWNYPFPLQNSMNEYEIISYPPNAGSNIPLLNPYFNVPPTGQIPPPQLSSFNSYRFGIPHSN